LEIALHNLQDKKRPFIQLKIPNYPTSYLA
jgi:hypothetical protein